jgi:hypothetical protein
MAAVRLESKGAAEAPRRAAAELRRKSRRDGLECMQKVQHASGKKTASNPQLRTCQAKFLGYLPRSRAEKRTRGFAFFTYAYSKRSSPWNGD